MTCIEEERVFRVEFFLIVPNHLDFVPFFFQKSLRLEPTQKFCMTYLERAKKFGDWVWHSSQIGELCPINGPICVKLHFRFSNNNFRKLKFTSVIEIFLGLAYCLSGPCGLQNLYYSCLQGSWYPYLDGGPSCECVFFP